MLVQLTKNLNSLNFRMSKLLSKPLKRLEEVPRGKQLSSLGNVFSQNKLLYSLEDIYRNFTGLTSFGNFTQCVNIRSVRLPEGPTSLGVQAFWRDVSWDLLDLPSTMTNVNWGNVRYLAVLVCRATTPPTFRNNYYSSSTKLYVPQDSISLYQADANWSVYNNIYPIEGSEYED